MSLRQIIIMSSTRSNPKILRSEASTWGELQDSISSEFGDLKQMRAVVKETRATLELPEAILPEGDFTLFLSARQIKAGQVDIVAVLNALKAEFVSCIENIIGDIEDGDYESKSKGYPTAYTTPRVSQSDRDLLNSLSRM